MIKLTRENSKDDIFVTLTAGQPELRRTSVYILLLNRVILSLTYLLLAISVVLHYGEAVVKVLLRNGLP